MKKKMSQKNKHVKINVKKNQKKQKGQFSTLN